MSKIGQCVGWWAGGGGWGEMAWLDGCRGSGMAKQIKNWMINSKYKHFNTSIFLIWLRLLRIV